MKKNNLLFVSLAIVAFITISMALPAEERNLKVLPKDISNAKLDSIMETYAAGLGVKCNFCHVPKVSDTTVLDFASDKDPMKENARNMMRMSIELNTKYFYFDKSVKPEDLNVITCKTCHRGEPIPPEN